MKTTGLEILVVICAFNSQTPTHDTKNWHQISNSTVARQTRNQTFENFNGNSYNIPKHRFKDGSKWKNSVEELFPTLASLKMESEVDQ